MQRKQKQRDPILQGFLDSVFVLSHSKATEITYEMAVKKFRNFLETRYGCNESEIVSKIKNHTIDVYKLLNEFVIYLDKSGLKGGTIRTWLAAVKGFLRHLDVKIYIEDCKHSIRIPKIVVAREEPLTKELLLRILRNLNPKLQAVVLIAIASGMRIGEIVQLKIGDIDFDFKPAKIRIRGETTKTRESREAFLTEEATNALKDYLKAHHGWKEGQNNEHLQSRIVFGRDFVGDRKLRADNQLERGYHLTVENLLQKQLASQVEKLPDLCKKNENGRRVIHFHAFRKYFRTVVGNVCGRDFAEAIIGHKFYLSTYYNLSEAQKKELYLKAEPYLTISDLTKVEANLKDVLKKYDELEIKYNNLMRRFDEISVPVMKR